MDGDLLTSLESRTMAGFRRPSGPEATIGLHTREVTIDFGVVEMDDRRASSATRLSMRREHGRDRAVDREDPQAPSRGPYLDMLDLIIRLVAGGETVPGFRPDWLWLDIGRIDARAQATGPFESLPGSE